MSGIRGCYDGKFGRVLVEGPHDSSSGTEDVVVVVQAVADDATVYTGHVLIGPVDIRVVMYQ